MAENTLREENSENKGMEEQPTSEEPHPNPDAVSNESRENNGSVLVVKEEEISDSEPDTFYEVEVEMAPENNNVVEISNPEVVESAQMPAESSERIPGQMPAQVIPNIPAQVPAQVPGQMPAEVRAPEGSVTENAELARTEKKKKHRRRKKGSSKQQTCNHENKNFVVMKRRLRCAACLAPMCPECQSGVKSTLSNHLATSDNKNQFFYHCRMCRLAFKTNCALQAHSRIHGLGSPYVCPDCGSVYKSFYNLSLHLINKCCHVYKVMRGGCEMCLRHNMAVADYLAHIEQAHLRPIFKCSRCECVSDTGKALEQHFLRNHQFERTICLRYFSCTVCENLVFSEHIYWRHLDYHRDYSTVFKTGYLCACNQSFNTPSTLRAHLEGCSRKGVIPPQWSFLRITLRANEMHQARKNNTNNIFQDGAGDITDGESISEGDPDIDPDIDPNQEDNFEIDEGDFDEDDESRAVLEFLQEEGSSSSTVFSDVSSSQISSGSTSSTVFSDASSNQIRPPYVSRPILSSGSSLHNSESSGKDIEDGLEESFNELTFRDIDDNADGEVDESGSDFVFPKSPEMSSDNQDDEKEEEDEEELGEKISLGADGSPPDNERELSSDQDEQMERESPSIPIIDLDEAVSLGSPGEVIPQSLQENAKGEEDNAKADVDGEQNQNVVYDHIPCDHLGYVKVQQNQEPRDKNKNKKKKKKPAKTSEPSAEGAAAAGSSDNFVETSVLDEKTGFMKTKRVLIQRSELDKRNRGQFRANPGTSNESLSRDILRTKNSTFFSCPFCSVLFPKHGSSFQKFRLHMECYHPDASLDIDVDRSGAPRSETKFAVVGQNHAKSDNTSDEESGDLDDVNLEARMGAVMESNGDDRYATLNGFGSPESEGKGKGNISFNQNKDKASSAGKFDVEMKLVNDEKEEEKGMESNMTRPAAGARNIQENAEALVKPSLIQKIVQSKNNFSKQNPVKLNTPERDFKNVASTTNPRKYFSEDNGTRNLGMNRNFTANFARIDENDSAENVTLHRNQVSILNHKSKRMQDNDSVAIMQKNVAKEGAQKRRRRRRKSSKSSGSEFDNLSLCSRTTLERELFPNGSPESMKTPTKEMECDLQNEENSNDADLNGRAADRRNSRKESDVWSEFYKTLKVAETLKKVNLKDQESPGVEEASILTNYTNKRVVKKPKRYRESSESEESDDEKQSPNVSRSSEKAGEDEITAKKKNLIKRLENVDYRILDYVVNLLEKNEKSQVAAKKDESLKSSKKMSNGVKSGGKQITPVTDSGIQDVDGEFKNKGKPKKGKRQRRQRKNKKKGEVEDKKETDKDQEKDEKDQGQDRNRDQDRNQDRNQDQDRSQDQDREKEKDNEQKDSENGKDKDKDDDENKDKDSDKDKDKKDKKGKGKGRGKDKDKDKDNDKDEDKNITDFSVDEASWELQTGNNPENRNADKKKRRRKKTEPLILKERRRSSYEGESNPTEKKSGDAESFSSKKKRRLASRSQYHRRMSVSPESNEFSSGQVISTRAFEAERKFTCAICTETFSNKAEFKDHILNHRIDENTYQCMECGECFVVRPSLEKHLHAYHKIKDVEKYIEENEGSTPLRHDDSDSETLKENQCKVCRDEFPTALDLNKHFRIHGMAFLQQVKKEARHN